MKHTVTEMDVISVPVPSSTDSYSAVSNHLIIELVKEHARRLDFEISETIYRLSRNGNQMSGLYKLTTEDNEMSMMLGFFNSYDKSRRLGIGSGALVNICTNGMIMAEFKALRKHSGKLKDEVDYLIYNAIRQVRPQFQEAQQQKLFFQDKPITDIRAVHELVGEMFLTEDLLPAFQLTALQKGMVDPDNHFRILDNKEIIEGKTAWDYYNLVTEAYKSSPAIDFVDRHVRFHKYMKTKFGAADEPTTESTVEPAIVVPEVYDVF